MMIIVTIEGTSAYVLPTEVAAIVGIKERPNASTIYLKGGGTISVSIGADAMAARLKTELGKSAAGL